MSRFSKMLFLGWRLLVEGNMIESIKSIELLKGVKGRPQDLKAIANNLQRLSQLVTDFPDTETLTTAIRRRKGSIYC